MTARGWNDPAEDEINPHRIEERRHVRDELEARLRDRDVEVTGDETDEQILAIVEAVEAFEARRAQLGGDSFTNTMQSSDPDEERLVLPQRHDDETVDGYVRRIREATESLGG